MIVMIAAMDQNRVIGYKNQMPWQIPSELAHFRQTTAGHTVLMGRKTFEAIGRLLPKRHNIIVSTKPMNVGGDNVTVINDLEAFLRLWSTKEETLFIIGGATIYASSLPYVDQIIVSIVPGTHPGDTYFPQIPPAQFELKNKVTHAEFEVEYYEKRQA